MIERAVKHLDETVAPAEDSRMLAGAVLRAALPNKLLEDFLQTEDVVRYWGALDELVTGFRRELDRRRERGLA